jgi:hypothetical protein
MPRKSKGGSRQGTPGTSYGNRTDLNMPISTVPNQDYGMATQQAEAQRVVPMGASPVAASPASAMAQMPAGKPLPKPGELPFLEPGSNPDAPVTSGLPFGPGPGPTSAPLPSLASRLSNMSSQGGSSGLMELAAAARNLGL